MSATSYNVVFRAKGTTQVTRASYRRMFFDKTQVESTETYFFDVGLVKAEASAQLTWPSLIFYQSTNFFIGLQNFSFSGNISPQFSFQLASPYDVWSTSGYDIIILYYWNFRIRSCVAPENLYRRANQMCYSTCPPGSYENTTYSFCADCHYTCY